MQSVSVDVVPVYLHSMLTCTLVKVSAVTSPVHPNIVPLALHHLIVAISNTLKVRRERQSTEAQLYPYTSESCGLHEPALASPLKILLNQRHLWQLQDATRSLPR